MLLLVYFLTRHNLTVVAVYLLLWPGARHMYHEALTPRSHLTTVSWH